MRKISKKLTPKTVAIFTGMFLVVLAMLFILPRKFGTTQAAVCSPSYTQPIFNPYPVSNTDQDCHDYSFIRARVNGSSLSTGTVNAQAGDTVDVVLYVHNGAEEGSEAARGINLAVNANLGESASHNIYANVGAANTQNSISGSLNISTPSGARLEVVSGSEKWIGREGGSGNLDGLVNSSRSMPDQQACFGYVRFIWFSFKVVAQEVQVVVENPSGQISGRVTDRVPNQCMYNGLMSWTTSENAGEVEVTVKDPYTNEEKVFSRAKNDSNISVNWFTPNEQYRFTVWRLVGGQRVSFYGPNNNLETWVSVPNLDCGQNPVVPPPPPVGEKNFTLTADPSICVGQNTRYTITGTANLVGKSILWSSTKNGVATGEANAYVGQTIVNSSGLAFWSDVGGTWQTSQVGNWIKTATIDGISKEVRFEVKNCSTTPPPSALVCSPSVQNVRINESVSFSASGGNGNYSWNVSSANPSAGSGSVFTTRFAFPGSYFPAVSSNGNSTTCRVDVLDSVTPPPPTTLICSPSSQSITGTQTVTFSATGGSGNYVWSAPGANITYGTSNVFSTNYPTQSVATRKIVTLFSGTQNATCEVNINPINPQAGSLTINKLVKNISQNSSFGKTLSAENGNRIIYQIAISANNGAVSNVNVTENLPNNFNYSSNTLKVDGQNISDGQINSISLGNFSSGQSKNITLEGYVSANSGQCQTTITNSASVSGSGTGSVSDSATVYVNQACGTSGYAQLGITKLVRNQNSSGYFSKNTNALNSNRVQFEITVRNVGNITANNVRVRDFWSNSLSFVSGSVYLEGGYTSGSLIDNDLYIGSLSAGAQKRITFEAVVNSSGGSSIQNTARATADNASSVTDDAWVFVNNSTYNPCPYGCVSGGNVNLSFQKRATNDTKGANAVSVIASREDYITYILTVTNSGNAPANNFVITDDLSGVLSYADISDNGGGSVSGSTINFPGITVPAYGSVSKSFKVRVKYNLPSSGSFTINNTYGNTVSIQIGNPGRATVLGAFISPKTGANTTGLVFSAVLTILFAIYKNRKIFFLVKK